MTLGELCGIMRDVGLPYAQVQWDVDGGDAPPPLPYALLVPETSRDIMAGEANRMRLTPYRCEVYTRGRDMALEGRIEAALVHARTGFVRRTIPLGAGVLETTYTVTITGR